MKIVLNGLEITQEAANERLDNKDLIAGLHAQSSEEDAVQTLLIEDTPKLNMDSVLVIVFEKSKMNMLERATLSVTQYLLNLRAKK